MNLTGYEFNSASVKNTASDELVEIMLDAVGELARRQGMEVADVYIEIADKAGVQLVRAGDD